VVIGFLSDIAITAEPQQCSPQTRFNYRRYNNTKMAFKELFCFLLLYCLLLGEFAQQTATAISEKFPMQFKFKLRGSTAAWFSRVFPSNIGRS